VADSRLGPWDDPLGESGQVWDPVELTIRGYRCALKRRGRACGSSPTYRDRAEFEQIARWAVEASRGKRDREAVVFTLLAETLSRMLDEADAAEAKGSKAYRTPGTWRSRLVDLSVGLLEPFEDAA
jgi:hypothetical protein